MDYYGELEKETLNVKETWELFRAYARFQHMYIKFMKRTRLACRVFKKAPYEQRK